MSLKLITNSGEGGTLYDTLKSRLRSRDLTRVDIIVSYIKASGVRTGLFKDVKRGVKIRVITTWQLGISDFESAIESLVDMKNVELKVFTAPTPSFHAKGWLFHHEGDTSKNTAIIGSSNISESALKTGVEFNTVVVGNDENAAKLFEDFGRAFDTHWDQSDLVTRQDKAAVRLELLLRSRDWDRIVKDRGTSEEREQWGRLNKEIRAMKDKFEIKICTELDDVQHGRPHVGPRNIGRRYGRLIGVGGAEVSEDHEMFEAHPEEDQDDLDLEAVFKAALESLDLAKMRDVMNKLEPLPMKRDELINEVGRWTGKVYWYCCSPLWFLLHELGAAKTSRSPTTDGRKKICAMLKFLVENGAHPNKRDTISSEEAKATKYINDQGAELVPIVTMLVQLTLSCQPKETQTTYSRKAFEEAIQILIGAKTFNPNAEEVSLRWKEGSWTITALGVIALFHANFNELRWAEEFDDIFLSIAVQLLEKGARTNLALTWTKTTTKLDLKQLSDCDFVKRAMNEYDERKKKKEEEETTDTDVMMDDS